MKTLVTFYSRDGHTRKSAEIIANVLNADIDERVDKKSRRGILGFLRAGYDATRGKTTDILFTKDPEKYDMVVLGTPVWNGRITPAVRTYLLRKRENIKRCAFFATYAGRLGKCLRQMHELYSGNVVTEKVIFRKKIEEEAKIFAEELKRLLNLP